MNPYKVDIQSAYPAPLPFTKKSIQTWALLPLSPLPSGEVTVRFVTNEASQALNHQYRNKNSPTNVLAFPSTLPDHIKQKRKFLGDLIIAPEVLYTEHLDQGKPLDAHWAHIIIHGVLHLLGYTHEEEDKAIEMQALEKEYLQQLHFPDPYSTEPEQLA